MIGSHHVHRVQYPAMSMPWVKLNGSALPKWPHGRRVAHKSKARVKKLPHFLLLKVLDFIPKHLPELQQLLRGNTEVRTEVLHLVVEVRAAGRVVD